jgi:outer membrane protein TolC
MMKIIVGISLMILPASLMHAQAQPEKVFSLEQAYENLDKNWPAAQKTDIQKQITELNRRLARSGRLPEIQLTARTSYQSDVTEVPFSAPGTEPPLFSKDHYNVSLNLSQTVLDGRRTRTLQEAEKYSGDAVLAKIESEMLTARRQMEQIWFGILMLRKQEVNLGLLHDDISRQLEMVHSKVKNGVLLPGDELVMKAELISVEQEQEQTRGDLNAGYAVLSEILGVELGTDVDLEIPDISGFNTAMENKVQRPEYDQFDAGEFQIQSQKKLAGADRLPSVALFANSAYGRPGLNVFEDDLQLYWIVGLRAQWSFRNTRNASKKTDLLDLQRRNLRADRDVFTRHLNSELKQSEEQIEVIRRQIEQDEEILGLRTQVVKEKQALLEEGVITSTQFMAELNAENRARLNLELRKIRLSQAIVEYETKKGKRWNP